MSLSEQFEYLEIVEAFEFLDDLRASGVTNMYGAAPYLQRRFGFDITEARAMLKAWMNTFDGDTSHEDRAEQALGGSAP